MKTTTSRALLVALLITGCNSDYVPRRPNRVSTIMRDGQPVYVRDGRIYRQGLLGGGLVDAVAGNPAAVAAANEYHGRLVTGLAATLVGLVGVVGGASVMVNDSINSQAGRNQSLPALAMLGGAVLELIGFGYLASAEPYRLDAINLFNDGGEAPPGLSLQRPAPRPAITLQMHD